MLKLIFIAAAMAATVQDQTPTPAPAQATPTGNCSDHLGARDFDFWIGYWRVEGSGGAVAGHNRIVPIENGCGLMEHWRAENGGTGSSLNYFNPVTGEWRQLWISNGGGGYAIDISGGLNAAGEMAMVGEIYYFGTNTRFPMRGVWTPESDGTVTQTFHQQSPERGEWTLWFQGRYVPIPVED